MKHALATAALLVCCAAPAAAGSVDGTMLKLDPEERARQACIIKGIATVRQDKALPAADRLKTSIFSHAEFDGSTHVVSKGGAVRAKKHWFKLTFDCTVTPDQMKAITFSYKLGAEIPKEDWNTLGLWQ